MTGVIEGGWTYVYSAYGLTWLILIGYGVRLWMLSRRGRT